MNSMEAEIRLDDLSSEESQSIALEHLAGMLANTPSESVHALPLEKLRTPAITFWTAWIGSELCGCGALKMLNPQRGEVKTMRTRRKRDDVLEFRNWFIRRVFGS